MHGLERVTLFCSRKNSLWLALKSGRLCLPKIAFWAGFYSATVGRTASIVLPKLQPRAKMHHLFLFIPSSISLAALFLSARISFALLLSNLSAFLFVSYLKFFYIASGTVGLFNGNTRIYFCFSGETSLLNLCGLTISLVIYFWNCLIFCFGDKLLSISSVIIISYLHLLSNWQFFQNLGSYHRTHWCLFLRCIHRVMRSWASCHAFRSLNIYQYMYMFRVQFG